MSAVGGYGAPGVFGGAEISLGGIGNAATSYGAGGAGGAAQNSASNGGGDGAAGVVIITEFTSA